MKKQTKAMAAVMTYSAIILFAAWLIITSLTDGGVFMYFLSIPILLIFLFFGTVLNALSEMLKD